MEYMKILLISHSPNLYGAERCFLDLAEGLARTGQDFSVLCPAPGPLSQRLRALKIPVFYMPFPGIGTGSLKEILRFILLFFPAVIRLSRWMRKNRITIVYNNTINALFGPVAAKLIGIPSVWHIHEVKPGKAVLTKMAGIVINVLSSNAIFNSYATMKAFAMHPHASWYVFYNGIETRPCYEKSDFASNFVMAFAGQMAGHKKPERFLCAFSQVRKQTANIKGIMAGDGPMLPALRSLAQDLKIADDIVFTGYLSDLQPFYANIDVLVLTSDREAFGRVILEAMSYGRAVIASAVGGVPEVVEDGRTGYLVPAEDISAYARKILCLFENPELCRQMGENARRSVSERFGKSRYQEELIRILTNEPS